MNVPSSTHTNDSSNRAGAKTLKNEVAFCLWTVNPGPWVLANITQKWTRVKYPNKNLGCRGKSPTAKVAGVQVREPKHHLESTLLRFEGQQCKLRSIDEYVQFT